ncbi:hypothetical protein ACET3Z_008804 [Daucus carota]
MLDVSYTAIEQLPDSIVHLIELVELKLISCKKLRRLPELLGWSNCLRNWGEKMQSLEVLRAYSTAIEELPDSVGQLSRLQVLDLSLCTKLKILPHSIWQLTSVALLSLDQVGMIRVNWPDR